MLNSGVPGLLSWNCQFGLDIFHLFIMIYNKKHVGKTQCDTFSLCPPCITATPCLCSAINGFCGSMSDRETTSSEGWNSWVHTIKGKTTVLYWLLLRTSFSLNRSKLRYSCMLKLTLLCLSLCIFRPGTKTRELWPQPNRSRPNVKTSWRTTLWRSTSWLNVITATLSNCLMHFTLTTNCG